MADQELAQLNIARILAPLESDAMRGFVDNLDRINALAESSAGFVWRLQTEEGDATALRPFGDDDLLVNLSVWRDVESLRNFVFRTAHSDFLQRRREWFQRMEEDYTVLWWVAPGELPTIDDAIRRLGLLRERGPSAQAFTFRDPFPAPSVSGEVDRR
jgi:hypothetical protein